VWLVPLMIWLLHGPLSGRRGARILGWTWLALNVIGVPWLLSFAQPTIWQNGRPWYQACSKVFGLLRADLAGALILRSSVAQGFFDLP
jgi:hypothetical protein